MLDQTITLNCIIKKKWWSPCSTRVPSMLPTEPSSSLPLLILADRSLAHLAEFWYEWCAPTDRRGGKLTNLSDHSAIATQPVSYTHLRAHETPEHLVCRLLLEKKKK
eukprot:TRINITY_DN20333_c0_g1_i1.p1 TRINITY_DN20333_c0_g1~~TRINITY_DN20333_c0_g1_i1.p1  ORF type:complete len:107 (+),score=9.22 TRINITY_DN20333_c0_g1_i1:254-574(+)